MSCIPDPLQKSENERQRQTSPALFEVKVAAPRRKFPLWAVALGVLLGINLLGLLWMLLLRAPAAATPAIADETKPPAAAAAASTPPGMITVPATVTIPTTVNIPISSAPSVTMGSRSPDPGVVAPS